MNLGVSPEEFDMMDSREYFHAIMVKRELSRELSRERYELIRFHVFLDRLTNPYLKKKPKLPVDVIKFLWEMEKKMSVDEMKQAFKQIASSYRKPKVRNLHQNPPVHTPKKKKGNKDAS